MEDAFEAEQDISLSEEESAMDVSEEGKAARQNKLRKMMEDDGNLMKRKRFIIFRLKVTEQTSQ